MGIITLLSLGLPALPADSTVVRRPIEPNVFTNVYLAPRDGLTLGLECQVPDGEEAVAFLSRFLRDPDLVSTYGAARGVVIPFKDLNRSYQRALMLHVFEYDYVDEQGWHHTVVFGGGDGYEETLWGLCTWLTGSGPTWQVVRDANRLTGSALRPGDTILFPAKVLLPEMREPVSARAIWTPAPDPPADAQPIPEAAVFASLEPIQIPAPARAGLESRVEVAVVEDSTPADPVVLASTRDEEIGLVEEAPTADVAGPETVQPPSEELPPMPDWAAAELSYGRDGQGEYAVYRLKPGEAIYSAVAVRFTDYVGHLEVMGAAELIRERSGITDVRSIKEGTPILIPVEILSPQFKPRGNEAREDYDRAVAESERLREVVLREAHSKDLEGVVVVLDSGHGSRDVGKMHPSSGLYEDEINYDIMCRVKLLLETQTRAKVYVTMLDPKQGYAPTNATRFEKDFGEVVLTTPPYPSSPDVYDTNMSANLRFYLANDVYDREVKAGVDPRKIVFTSFHVDSLHPQLRGAMIYIPGARIRANRPTHTPSSSYKPYAEARAVTSTAEQRLRDEALSRAFAETLLHELGVKRVKRFDVGPAIRSEIRRDRNTVFVPAVLHGNKIPTKILVECANMNNATDRERLADPAWRQLVAEAYVNALKAHFGS